MCTFAGEQVRIGALKHFFQFYLFDYIIILYIFLIQLYFYHKGLTTSTLIAWAVTGTIN